MAKVDVFVFPSESLENIDKGVAARRWAVPGPPDAMRLEGRAAKMTSGSRGIFYLVRGGLMVPFTVASPPDQHSVERDIWAGEYHFPFDIAPLGPPTRYLFRDEIASFLRDSIPRGTRWNHTVLVAGRTVFNPSRIEASDWDRLVDRLKFRHPDF